MANARICRLNLADAGRVSASSQVLTMPVDLLLGPHVEQRFRALGSTVSVVLDLGSLQLFDLVALRGLTLGAASSVRLRASATDPAAEMGLLADYSYNDGVGQLDRRYGALTCLLPATVAARYVRFDISDPGAAMIEAGRVWVGQTFEFAYNFAYGWQIKWVDRSGTQESRGGQTLVQRSNKYRLLNLNFEWVTQSQRFGLIEEIDRLNGVTDDVLIVTDAASASLARDSILGLMTDITPVIQPQGVWDSQGPLFSKAYEIKERL